MRKIEIYSTKGEDRRKILSDATTWGVLKDELIDKGYEPDQFKVGENKSMTTLENAKAKLPTGDFTLYLIPKKTKSGMDLKKDQIICLINNNPELVKFLNKNRSDWENLSKENLKTFLKEDFIELFIDLKLEAYDDFYKKITDFNLAVNNLKSEAELLQGETKNLIQKFITKDKELEEYNKKKKKVLGISVNEDIDTGIPEFDDAHQDNRPGVEEDHDENIREFGENHDENIKGFGSD